MGGLTVRMGLELCRYLFFWLCQNYEILWLCWDICFLNSGSIFTSTSYKMIFWRFFTTCIPPVVLLYSFYGEVFHLAVSAADSCMHDLQMVPVGGYWRLCRRWVGCLAVLHVWFNHPGMSAVTAAASYRHLHQVNDQQISRFLPQPL